ncbi:MAG: hypothetical protein ACXVAX_02760 [Pseudobdellovibrio sp.]
MKLNLLAMSVLLGSALNVKAATFECQTFLNLDVISSQVIETKLKDKVDVDSTDVARSYMTEKADNTFMLEVYLPDHEMRIYSEAAVTAENATITASMWARDQMIDVVCRKLSK